MFKKATKAESKLRMAISGPSGSGKTYTSLVFASALNRGGGIAVVDTEHGSASKYADQFDFDVAEMTHFHPSNYVKAIKAAADAGYDVVVLDSISHAWTGKGGILDMVGGNFSKWKDVNPIEQAFVEAIIGTPIHIIATMRAKAQYEVEKDERGKAVPRKVGMGSIQRDGMEYEFDITCMMDVANNIEVEKTRCSAINGQRVNRPGSEFMAPIISWLNNGSSPVLPESLDDVPELSPHGEADTMSSLPAPVAEFVQHIRSKNTGKPATKAQYGYLASVIDAITDGNHSAVLSAMLGGDVGGDNSPSATVCNMLLSELCTERTQRNGRDVVRDSDGNPVREQNPDYNPDTVAMIGEVWDAVRGA